MDGDRDGYGDGAGPAGRGAGHTRGERREEAIRREVMGAVAETRELPDGDALRCPGEARRLDALAQSIRAERRCPRCRRH